MGIELPKLLHMLDKHSTTWATLQSSFFILFLI
jgi:hypothetical protein